MGVVNGTEADPGDKPFFLTLTGDPASHKNRKCTIKLLCRTPGRQPLCVLALIPICKQALNL